jgi:hypothetical protein
MAQLKLSMSEHHANTIRRLAAERGLGISAFVVDQIVGTQDVELAPESVARLDEFGHGLAALGGYGRETRQLLEALAERVAGLESGGVDLGPLDRRLARLEEMAGI